MVEIRAGAGGDEAALWAGTLYEMYQRQAERQRWKNRGALGIALGPRRVREIVFEVKGRNAYSRLKHESGVHRVQRVRDGVLGRIHTSTATVAVLPAAENVEVDIRPEDLKIDVFRSAGPGGSR